MVSQHSGGLGIICGYFPAGLTLERQFRDMESVPFNPGVWPKFLRENAIRVFKLEDIAAARP